MDSPPDPRPRIPSLLHLVGLAIAGTVGSSPDCYFKEVRAFGPKALASLLPPSTRRICFPEQLNLFIAATHFKAIVARVPSLEELVCRCSLDSPSFMQISALSSLTVLDLSLAKALKSDIRACLGHIANNCLALRELYLNHLDLEQPTIDIIACSLTNLEAIGLEEARKVSLDPLVACRRLTSINILGTPRSWQLLEQLVSSRPIRRLAIETGDLACQDLPPSREIAESIQTFALRWKSHLPSPWWSIFGYSLPNIQAIALHKLDSSEWAAKLFVRVSDAPNLQYLSLDGPIAHPAVSFRSASLVALSLGHFNTDTIELHTPNLRHLHLISVRILSSDPIVVEAPLLEVLELRKMLPDGGFAIQGQTSFHHLWYLNTRKSNPNDESLSALVRRMPRLEVLDTYYNDLIGDLTLKAIGQVCAETFTHALFYGDMGTSFTADGIESLRTCKKLKVLDASYNYDVFLDQSPFFAPGVKVFGTFSDHAPDSPREYNWNPPKLAHVFGLIIRHFSRSSPWFSGMNTQLEIS